MANIKSAEKRIKQTIVRTERNKARTSRVRSFVRKLEEAISAGDKANAQSVFSITMSELHKAVKFGVMKKGTVDRKLSRMNTRVKAM